ncbi:MAG: hypothetical protein ACYCX4_12550 [Bacillota bacterium]
MKGKGLMGVISDKRLQAITLDDLPKMYHVASDKEDEAIVAFLEKIPETLHSELRKLLDAGVEKEVYYNEFVYQLGFSDGVNLLMQCDGMSKNGGNPA